MGLTYTCLTYEELVRGKELSADGQLPPLLPITVYNGPVRWRAATDISQLIAPVPPPLRRHLPRAEHVLLDLQRIGERDPYSTDLVTSLGRTEREPSAEHLQRLMRDMAAQAGDSDAELFARVGMWATRKSTAHYIMESSDYIGDSMRTVRGLPLTYSGSTSARRASWKLSRPLLLTRYRR